MKKQNGSIVKIANMQLILDTLVAHGPLSNEEIVFHTRLSRPTVIKNLETLTENGIVDKNGFLNDTGGRNAQLYDLGTKKFFAIGIDFEFPMVRFAITNLKMEIQYFTSWMFHGNELQEQIIEKLIKEIKAGINSVYSGKEVFIGMGIGLPGLIDIESGVSIYIERINGWKNVPICQILFDEFHIPVHIENDVHLLAYTNKFRDTVLQNQNYAYISLRYGVGMALFLDNKFYGGSKGNAGFWGHTVIDPQGDVCRCKKNGCIETFSSSWAIVEYYLKKSHQEQNEDITLENVVDAFLEGNDIAIDAIQRACRYMGLGISNLIMLLDISTVVINGLPSRCKVQMVEWIYESIRANMINHINEVRIIDEELNEEEKALGGARWIVKSFLHLTKDSVCVGRKNRISTV